MENIQNSFPGVKYIKVLKHPEDWDKYSEELCNLYGFLRNTHPLIFKSNGKFIGNKDDFFKFIETNFNVSISNMNLDFSIIRNLTQENIKKVNDEFSERQYGLKLIDRIDLLTSNLSLQDGENECFKRYNTSDTDYSEGFLNGMKIYYKYSSKYLPIDEVICKFGHPKCKICKSYKEYSNYNEIMEQGHIEIELPPQLLKKGTAQINTEYNIAGQSSSIQIESKENEEEEEEYDEMSPDQVEGQTQKSLKKKIAKFQFYKTFEVPEYEIKNKFDFLLEENFGMGFLYCLNPFSTFYGETILFHQSSKSESLILKDFGKLPSLRKIPYDGELFPLISHMIPKEQKDIEKNLSWLETNLFGDCVISDQDLQYMSKAVKDINGMALLRVLPYKYNDYKSLCSNKIRILQQPLKDINYEEIPMNLKVKQAVRELKRKKLKFMIEKQNMDVEKVKVDLLLDNEELGEFFEINEMFEIETYKELNIQHKVKSYNYNTFNHISQMKKDILMMLNGLNINIQSGLGMVLILTKEYLMICPLANPYTFDQNHVPFFAEPQFFAGIFNFPQIEAEWPETIQSPHIIFNPEEVLRKSTNI
jgi:hypothetical protein